MSEQQVFVVCGEQGEYSDRRVWVVAVDRVEATARARVEQLSGWTRAWYAQHRALLCEYEYEVEQEIIKSLHSFEPNANEDEYDPPSYFIQTVPLYD